MAKGGGIFWDQTAQAGRFSRRNRQNLPLELHNPRVDKRFSQLTHQSLEKISFQGDPNRQ